MCDAVRRLPAIKLISDPATKTMVVNVAESEAPSYFWEAPAASTYNHHNPYCCGERGLWIHTLMVATAYERLVDTYLAQDRITTFEADLGRAAVILHDMRKYGDTYWDGKHADKDHDIQMAEVAEDHGLEERAVEAIRRHMGDWYKGPAPESSLDHLVHNADMMGSTKNGTLGIYQKPDEISELYPMIPEAEL